MNIEFRPSGRTTVSEGAESDNTGRGEYELAGRQGDLRPHDFFNLPMFLEVNPGSEINARSHCILESGKPRIRQFHAHRNTHPYALIAAAMMVPKPRRELNKASGANLLERGRFVVLTVRVDLVPQQDRVLVRPVTVRLGNNAGACLDIVFADRMMRVSRVWAAAAERKGALAMAVRAHTAAFTSAASTQTEMSDAFSGLYSALDKPVGDMLPLLERHFGLSVSPAPSDGRFTAEIEENHFSEEVDTAPAVARIERARMWRFAAIRGPSAAEFRRKVQQAYDSRCMFSGQRLPRTEATSIPGVDAAHILPWSRFDLDAIRNGLCLNRQCHWAFDQGLFRLAYDDSVNAYVVSIPDPVRHAAQAAQFDIAPFDAIAGPVPINHLPADEAFWPSRQYLTALNRFLDGEAA